MLDDVWDLAAIRPLREALPLEACLLITTRSDRLAADLRGRVYPLAILIEADALALLRARTRHSTSAEDTLLAELAKALGSHALALDIAGRSLDRLPKTRWADAAQAMAQQVREGTGFGELYLPGDEPRVSEAEAALKFSYDDLNEPARARFRSLGAFAPDGWFSVDAAAGLWDCQPTEAEPQLQAFTERGLLGPLSEGELWRQHSLLRAYALGMLRRAQEEDIGRRRQAAVYLALMGTADDAQRYYRLLPEYTQLQHAFGWAVMHDLALAQSLAASTANLQAGFNLVHDQYAWAEQLLEQAGRAGDAAIRTDAIGILAVALHRLAAVGGEDRGARLREALAAYDEALHYKRPDVSPFDYAMMQNNRANLLYDMAGLPGEDRAARLRAALAAYDEALQYRRPDVTPLEYATTQNNRANALSVMAALPGEDRAARLRAALAAYDEALKHLRPDVTPLDYAMTQNNRARRLSEMAALPGQDRRARLREALAAYDEALKYYRPDAAPIEYATTQNNRANLLSEMAALPGQNQAARLQEALAAYDEAVKYRGADAAPLGYAAAQNNRATVLSQMAALPGQNRTARLREALAAYAEALKYYLPDVAPLGYAATQNNRAAVLSVMAALPGADRSAQLREALAACDEALKYRRRDEVPLDYATTQGIRAGIYLAFASTPGEDRQACLLEATRCAYTAFSLFQRLGHDPYSRQAAYQLARIANEAGALFSALWARVSSDPPRDWLSIALDEQG